MGTINRLKYYGSLSTAIFSMLFCWIPSNSTAGDNKYPVWNNLLLLSGENLAIVEIEENIEMPTTWINSNLYIIKESIYVSNALSIEPGTLIKFYPNQSINVDDNGVIIAEGTSSRPIIFTSFKDDSHAGDTNGDGNTSTAAKGDWGEIELAYSKGSVFDYCQFFYGGSPEDNCTMEVYESKATITNCTFAHNFGALNGDGPTGALDAKWALHGTIIAGNRFYDNALPLTIAPDTNIDDSNIFQSQDGSQKNSYNGIFVETYIQDITKHINWQETEVAFAIIEGDLDIREGASLTLGNNVVLKVGGDREIELRQDASIHNHSGIGVFFTSFRDDDRKGDTNGDGNITSPSKRDWRGVYDYETDTYLAWPNILYDSF